MNEILSINKDLVKELGPTSSIFYAYIFNRRSPHKGWFSVSIENVIKDLGLTSYQQRIAIKSLEKKGLVEQKNMGKLNKRYLRFRS